MASEFLELSLMENYPDNLTVITDWKCYNPNGFLPGGIITPRFELTRVIDMQMIVTLRGNPNLLTTCTTLVQDDFKKTSLSSVPFCVNCGENIPSIQYKTKSIQTGLRLIEGRLSRIGFDPPSYYFRY
jgi:hypothetical protein